MFQMILPDAMVQAGGWAILHSLWQGAIITLLLASILGRSRQASPLFRYYASLGALLLLSGGVAVTFYLYYEPASGLSPVIPADGVIVPANSPGALSETVITSSGNDLSRFFPFLLQVWLIGVALMSLRMLAELFYLHRLRSVQTQAVSAAWRERLNTLKWKLSIVEPVVLRESLRVTSPMLIGWFKPVILLPLGMLSALSPAQVECVLAHELAHIRRMDYLVNLIQSAIEVLLFFNPAVWWISTQIREEREHCCDELAVSITGDRVTLVKTLAQLEEWRLRGGQLALAFNGRPQGVLGRVQRLLGGENSTRIISRGLCSALFFCMVIGLLAFRTQSETSEPKQVWENTGLEAITSRAGADPAIVKLPVKKEKDKRGKSLTNADDGAVISREFALPLRRESTTALLATRDIEPILSNQAYLDFPARDTTPEELIRKEMRAVQQEMERLQREMMNSPEMQQIRELTRKHEQEIRGLQEKIMQEQGGYENLMKEQQRLMENMERKQRQVMESETVKRMQAEQQRMAETLSREVEALRLKFRDNPELLGMKVDSISRIFESRNEALEEQFEETFQAFEKEMEALENSPEMKALQERMEKMDLEMERLMEQNMQPLEEQMGVLQQALEEKFEQQMHQLQEKMEKLEHQYRKDHNKREE